MNATKWFAWVLSMSISFAGCAQVDDEESLEVDDDDAEAMDDAAPAQDNEPAPTNPTGSCSATSSSGGTVSGGTYETDDDGYLWCCTEKACIECGGSNTCTATKQGLALPPPSTPPIKMK